ncbi:MAG TPA: hypothetical protein P5232_00750 [Candidatus Moranbacteria bacterium]|nr:hypothetical protein [Candidatus Moranbacteria bacterium]
MFKNFLSKKELLSIFILLFLGFAWLSLILTLLGFFYKVILLTYIFFAVLFFAYLLWKNFGKIKISKNEIFFIASALILIGIFSFFSSPTIFSGRDQGSLSEAAIRLSQNHQLTFSFPAEKEFFKLYGPGQALNFPGFSYTEEGNLITQFPLGYIAWLATFFALFGLSGLIIANGASFFLFSCAFYLLAKRFLTSFSAWLAWLLTATAFTSFWFFKFTLSENLALALVWLGLYFFAVFWDDPKKLYFIVFVSAFGLLIFTRIEGLAFLAMTMLLLFWKFKKQPEIRKVLDKKIIFLIFGIFALYIANIFIDWQFFTFLAKAVLKPFINSGEKISFSSDIFSAWKVLGIFYLYGLLTFFLLGLAGFFFALRQKKIELLIPYLVVLPAFIYVIFPNISSDHPWMLRRFMFAVIPISILYSVIFLENYFSKKIFSRFFYALLIIVNLGLLCFFLGFIPNKNLLSQIGKISDNFKETDLVLVDQKATGDNWSMMSGPLNFIYKKQAVYFFNPKDLEKIDLEKFTGVYFIIPNDNLEFYSKNGIMERLIPVKDYSIENNILKNFASKNLPKVENQLVLGKIYLLK